MKNSLLVTLALFAVGMLVSACDFIPGNGYDVIIRTDKDSYETAPHINLELSIENVGDKTVYLSCGGDIAVQEWIGDDLNHSWAHFGAFCLGFNPIAPGEKWVRNWGPPGSYFDKGPTPEFSTSVRYRISVWVYGEEDFDTLLGGEGQLSNEFVVIPASE